MLRRELIKLYLSFLFIFLGYINCNIKSTAKDEYSNNCEVQSFIVTSFNEVINNPKAYDSKFIEISGFYRGRFEQSALFYNKRSGKEATAIWIDFGVNDALKDVKSGRSLLATQDELNKIINRKIIIRGYFDLKNTGHLNQYFGAIKSICYLKIL